MDSMLKNAVRLDRQRVEYMINSYKSELKELPKGTISEKHVGSKTYYYLKYRSGSKVISDYINAEDLPTVLEIVERKKHIRTMIHFLKNEKAMADSILKGRRRR